MEGGELLAGAFSFVSMRRGKTGLSEQEPSPQSFFKRVCVNYLVMRAGVNCTTQVGAAIYSRCVCVCVILISFFPPKPPWLKCHTGSCSGLYARPVSTPISSSDLLLPHSADTISSPSFPAHFFPSYILSHRFFFAPPPFSHPASLVPAGSEVRTEKEEEEDWESERR